MKDNKIISKLNIASGIQYKLLTVFCIIIHSSIAIFSLCFKIYPLLIFNIVSIIIYVIGSFLIQKHTAFVTYVGFVEIILHSFICVILLGNNFGFSMYFILLIPMVYNILHSINTNRFLLKASMLSLLSFVIFVTCYVLSNIKQPLYMNDALKKVRPYVYVANMLIVFLALSFFSILFILETVVAYNKLYNQNKQLDTIANTDPLTGLYNRRTMTKHIMDFLSDYKINKQPFSIIICDIDNFKIINDTYGHEGGDEVLRSLSRTFESLTRDKDFLCRWGGEEFLILLKNTDLYLARSIADRIRVNVENSEIIYNDNTIKITITLGVASVTEEQDYDILFKLADERLYKGKNSGKNVVV